jgi:hypothetical protein
VPLRPLGTKVNVYKLSGDWQVQPPPLVDMVGHCQLKLRKRVVSGLGLAESQSHPANDENTTTYLNTRKGHATCPD